MKELKNIFTFAVILFIVLKIIDFASLTAIDVIILVLFCIYTILEIITFIRNKRGDR